MTDSDRDINSDDDYMKTYNVIHVGDILFEGHTSKQFAFGRFVLDDYRDGIVSHVFDIYRPKAKMNLSFWKYYIHDENVMRPILVRATSNARMLNALSSSEFLKQSLFVPSENEQAKIGNLLEQIDSTIALHQRKLAVLKKLKRGYLQKMFPKQGKSIPVLRFAEFDQNWEQRKLGKIGKTFTGLSGKTKEDFGHGDAKFVTYMNVFSNPVSDLEMIDNIEVDAKQNSVEYGDVFFTTSSETPEEVGMSSVWLGNKDNVYLNSFSFGYRPDKIFAPYYLAFMLRSPVIRRKFMFLAQGISRYNISKTKVMNMEVPVPKLEEQNQIGTFFQHLDHLITLHQRKLSVLKKLKRGYLQKIFC